MASITSGRLRRAHISVATVASVACAATPAASAQTVPTDFGASVGLPSVTTGDVNVLGPSTARVEGSVNTANLATSVFFRYGEGSVLDQRTPNITVQAGAQPAEVLEDLLDLKPGSSYSVQLVMDTPQGIVGANTVQFTTPNNVFVDPRTGVVKTAGKRTRCTIMGTAGKNRLVGTRKRDVICGLGGNDRILGRGGNDLILGGTGNDRASGGNGRDRLYGNSGRDRLYGNKGRDRLYGGNGVDRLNTASNGRRGDYVSGGKGRDRATVNKGDRASSIERLRRR
jgi:Ca2+-binding RTX toxin-like protein